MLLEDANRRHEKDTARIEELADRYEDLRGKYDTLAEMHDATMRALQSTLGKLTAFDAQPRLARHIRSRRRCAMNS